MISTLFKEKPITGLIFLGLLLFVLFLVDLQQGALNISFSQILQILVFDNGDTSNTLVLKQMRLPKALLAILVGASLAMAGCLLQTLLNNPMASPFSLGISSAAAFGAAIAITSAISIPWLSPDLSIALFSFLAALLSSFVLFWFVSKTQARGATLILVGILINFAFQSALSATQFYSSPEDLAQITFWMFGSLEHADNTKVLTVFSVMILCFIITWRKIWTLTALRQGDTRAQANGVSLKKTRLLFFILSSFLTSISISFVGIIGFVGLISPHIARSLFGEDHRFLLPGSMLLGALLLLSASIFSKMITPNVIFPIGIATSLVGIPLLFWVLIRRRGELWN